MGYWEKSVESVGGVLTFYSHLKNAHYTNILNVIQTELMYLSRGIEYMRCDWLNQTPNKQETA